MLRRLEQLRKRATGLDEQLRQRQLRQTRHRLRDQFVVPSVERYNGRTTRQLPTIDQRLSEQRLVGWLGAGVSHQDEHGWMRIRNRLRAETHRDTKFMRPPRWPADVPLGMEQRRSLRRRNRRSIVWCVLVHGKSHVYQRDLPSVRFEQLRPQQRQPRLDRQQHVSQRLGANRFRDMVR